MTTTNRIFYSLTIILMSYLSIEELIRLYGRGYRLVFGIALLISIGIMYLLFLSFIREIQGAKEPVKEQQKMKRPWKIVIPLALVISVAVYFLTNFLLHQYTKLLLNGVLWFYEVNENAKYIPLLFSTIVFGVVVWRR